MDSKTFDEGLGLLVTTFRSIQPNKKEIKVWRLLLADLDNHTFMAGVLGVCQSRAETYPGTNIVALIRKEANAAVNPGQLPEEAWGEVMTKISAEGLNRKPVFSDPATTQAVKALGWRELCMTPIQELPIQRAHFFKIFSAYRARRETMALNGTVSKLLSGLTEQKVLGEA